MSQLVKISELYSFKMLLVLLCFSLFVISCSAQDIVFIDNNKYLGDNCALKPHKIPGICRPFKECPAVTVKMRKTNCGFNGTESIICCPFGGPYGAIEAVDLSNSNNYLNIENTLSLSNGNTKRISERKCEEYKAFLKEQKTLEGLDPQVFEKENELLAERDGGEPDYSHMVAIGSLDDFDGFKSKCEGTLISEKFVLTAAHCNVNKKEDIVRLGDYDFRLRFGLIGYTDQVLIERVIQHPGFSSSNNYHDLSLLELQGNIQMETHIRPACLWQKNTPEPTNTFALKWGDSTYVPLETNGLQKVSLRFMTNGLCDKRYQRTKILLEGIKDTQICYVPSTDGTNTCYGVSGGPLYTRYIYFDEHVYNVIGIKSFGSFCNYGTPVVYTRISSYLDWIESIVWKDEIGVKFLTQEI